MVDADPGNCPACGADVAGDPWCSSCGLELGGDEAGELRSLAARVAAADVEIQAMWARRDVLSRQLLERRLARRVERPGDAAPPPPVFTARPSPARPPVEWSVERVRNLLLWTGAALLALSALAFAAVAWTHLGPGGRAALLVILTIISAFGARASSRRLPATSGALTGLTIALALVDWQIARRAGVAPGLSGPAWWAIGTAVVGAASFGLGRIAAPVPAHRSIAILAPMSAVLTIASVAAALWNVALGLSLLAAALVAADRAMDGRAVDPVVRWLLRVEGSANWIVGAGFALGAAFEPDSVADTFTPAAVMMTLIVVPGLVLARPSVPARDRRSMATVVIGVCIAAVLTLASTSVGPIGMVTLAAALGAAALIAAPSLSEVWRRAAPVAGCLAALPGLAFATTLALVAAFGPLTWFGDAWTGAMRVKALRIVAGPRTETVEGMGWCAVAILAVLAIGLWFGARSPRRAPVPQNALLMRVAGISVILFTIVLTPVAAGASALVACSASTAALVGVLIATAADTRRRADRALVYAGLATIPAIPAAGWAAVTPAASMIVLAIVVVAAACAAAFARAASLRAADAALAGAAVSALAAVIMLAADASVPVAGFAAATMAGLVLVIGTQARWNTPDGIALEAVGVTGMVVGVLTASPSPGWTAVALTTAVPLFSAASLGRHRLIGYGGAALAAALGATWAWLVTGGVQVVEAYTLPAAAAALGAALFARQADRVRPGPESVAVSGHSWLGLGPAIALVLGPTLVLAIARDDDTRAIVIGVAALIVLLVGAQRRLQAPIVLGALTLLALGVDKLGPEAARLPRWVMLAVAGSVLLWVGTTFERRRDDVQRVARSFERFG